MTFSEETVQKVWEKGAVAPNNDPHVWRKDVCGAWMNRSEHGNRNSKYGWEIDHITPESDRGGNELSNLRPLQWENNAGKQDGRLVCPVTAQETDNVHKASASGLRSFR